jgi:hypothetical protein
MKENLYYNQSAGPSDGRQGMGYAKGQKVPSYGTSVGSMRSMGSPETGIYMMPSPEEEEYDDDDYPLDDNDTDRFVNMINKVIVRADPTFWPRADRSSLGHSLPAVGLSELCNSNSATGKMPGVSSGISPFSSRALYPCGLGAPIGSGQAGQSFRTTGPGRKGGTQYGSSRAPVDVEDEGESEELGFFDIIDTDPEERVVLRQNARIMKVLNRLEEVDPIHSYIK